MAHAEHQAWALEQIRKRQKHWRGNRWIFLVLGAAMIAGGLYSRWRLMQLLPDLATGLKDMSEFVFLLGLRSVEGSVESRLLTWVGFLIDLFVIGRWRGNPSDILLLQFVDGNETQVTASV